MKFGDFLNTMAAKLGLQNDPQLVSLLSNASVANSEIGDEFAGRMNTGLMSLDGAKSSTEVKKHFDAMALNAVDAKLLPLAQAYGATADFDTEKSTYKRIDILAGKIQAKIAEIEANAAKGEVTKDSEVKRLNGELQTLQSKLTAMTAEKDREIDGLKKSHERAMLGSLIDFALTGKPYANDKVDAKTNVMIARALIDGKLAEKGAVIVNDNGVLKVRNANAPELDLLDEGNKPVTFAGFTDKILADANLLKVSKTATPPRTPFQLQTQTPPQEGMENYNAAMQAAMAEAGVGAQS